jgi:hypothetical protein
MFAALSFCFASVVWASANVSKVDLFVKSARYPCFRQPIIMTSNSERTHVLAFAENRNVSACAPAASQQTKPLDDGQPNEVGSLLLRRSMDSGKTWGGLQTVEFFPGLNIDFLAGVADTVTNTVWLMLQKSSGVQVFTSSDEGATWSQPKDLTKDWNIKSWSPDIKISKLKPGLS